MRNAPSAGAGRKTGISRHRRRVVGAILVTGLLGSAAASWNAASSPARPLGYEDTKQYLRQMQTYGGDANVLASELREWLASLWHGERLPYTIAFLALLIAAGYWLLTRPPLAEEADGPENPRQS